MHLKALKPMQRSPKACLEASASARSSRNLIRQPRLDRRAFLDAGHARHVVIKADGDPNFGEEPSQLGQSR